MENLNSYDAAGTEVESLLFQQDVLADYDYWRGRSSGRQRQPEIELMLAILEDALRCFCKNIDSPRRRGKRIFKETEEWFFNPDAEDVFAFENVCALLRLDPDYIRRQLLHFKEARRPLKKMPILRRAAMAA